MEELKQKLLTSMLLLCTVLCATQVEAALIAHYAFDGSLTADSSGNGRAMNTSVSSPSFAGSSAFGSNAVSMNGSSQFLYRDDAAFDFGTGDFAVSLWYQRTDAGVYSLIGNGTKNSPSTFPNSGFILEVSGANTSPTLSLYEGNAPAEISTAVGSINDSSAFQHVLFQRDGGQYQLYVNGGIEGTASPALASLNTGLGFGIGAENVDLANIPVDGEGYHNGLIDEVFIFNNALTPSEITDLFTTNTFPGIGSGGSGGGGGSGGIPEPTSLTLLSLGLLFVARRKRRSS